MYFHTSKNMRRKMHRAIAVRTLFETRDKRCDLEQLAGLGVFMYV
jgi:hypothetical protein